jgi:hypothetical protein
VVGDTDGTTVGGSDVVEHVYVTPSRQFPDTVLVEFKVVQPESLYSLMVILFVLKQLKMLE